MGFEFARAIGVLVEIIPVGIPIAKQYVHDRTGQRAVGAGFDAQEHVGLFGGGVAIGVDHHQACAAFVAGADGVAHDIDLGRGGIGAPDHDDVGFRHLARVDTGQLAGAGHVTIPGEGGADGGVLAGITFGMTQAIDTVTHHQAHGAGVEIRPHRFRAVFAFGAQKRIGHFIERVVPTDRHKIATAFGTAAFERCGQARRMMDTLGVTCHLAADDAGGITVVARTAHAANGVGIEFLDFQGAGGGTVVGAGAVMK